MTRRTLQAGDDIGRLTGGPEVREARSDGTGCCEGSDGLPDLPDLPDLSDFPPARIHPRPQSGISRRPTRPLAESAVASFSSTVSRTDLPSRILRVVFASGPP